MNDYIKVKITEDDFSDRKKIFIGRRVGGNMEVIYSDKVESFGEGAFIDKPSLILNNLEFQSLVDAIHKDFKPSEGKFIAGKLIATEKHLEDLRQMLKLR
jgi:hypothetical protein